MDELDCEIEYLDEDAEIVQQCVQTSEITAAQSAPVDYEQKLISPLLVERVSNRKRKQKVEENDSDYVPSDDGARGRKKKSQMTRSKSKTTQVKITPKPVSARDSTPQSSKKTTQVKIPPKTASTRDLVSQSLKKTPQTKIPPKPPSTRDTTPQSSKKALVTKTPVSAVRNTRNRARNDWEMRKKLNVQIPDYDDPLCLPVRLLKRDPFDMKRLRNWNNLCLDHIKHCAGTFKTDTGETRKSKRTVIFRNTKNKFTGRVETAIWGKTSVQNEEGDKKSDIIQCILPKYREKKMLSFSLTFSKHRRLFRTVNEVLITKDTNKDEETLIVYKPREAVSSVFKTIKPNESESPTQPCEDGDDKKPEEQKPRLQEVACCKVCAPCYQAATRSLTKNDNTNIRCAVCSRTYVSVYNLLSHLKTHDAAQVRAHKRHISRTLARMVDYLYKCRICQEQFFTIKDLRKHVTKHQGKEMFHCEIGNHMTC